MIEIFAFIIIFGIYAFFVWFLLCICFPDIRRWYAVKFGKVKVWFEIEEILLKETRNIEGKRLEHKVGYIIVKCSNADNRKYLCFKLLDFRPCLVVEHEFKHKASIFPSKEEAERIIAEIRSNPDNFIIE